jgi:heme-degrading monooxygenase HmoA
MNRFRIAPGREAEFIEVWRQRDSRLAEVPGFKTFNLLQGPGTAEATVFVSHSTWDSAAAFEAWTRSESFRAAHVGEFNHWAQTDAGPVRIHLLRFTTLDAPKEAIEALGGVFKPMSQLRGSAMSELLLLREVFNLIVGAGGG